MATLENTAGRALFKSKTDRALDSPNVEPKRFSWTIDGDVGTGNKAKLTVSRETAPKLHPSASVLHF
jgi:hypothetical protein